MRLRSKVLLGLAGLFVTLVAILSYGAATFRRLEARMEAVNDLYVPAQKALNQVDSSFFLLESDLDKSLREGILRPKESLEAVLVSRLDFLSRLAKGSSTKPQEFSAAVEGLGTAYQEWTLLLQKVYADWAERASHEMELSTKRADFRFRLKSLIRDVDREMRSTSANVQSDLRRLGIALTFVLGFCFALTLAIFYWLGRSLRPMESLAEIMRTISQKGLNEEAVHRLASLPSGHDEIATLSRESRKMAASLLDKSKALHDQKQYLERAHNELARQNEELKSTQAKLLHSEKLGLVGRMAAQMAHEIRNPLNALNLHAEILEDQLRSDPEALQSLEPLRKEINRLIAVTESYLDLSRGPRLRKGAVQVNEVVEELQDLYQPLLREKGIFFTCDLADIPPLHVDRGQIAQVLGNLLKNASEAFDGVERAGGRYVRVITHFSPERSEVTVSVMDNGEGISPEQQNNVFSPFFTSKAQGTGLGLTFSRQVVEAHGGEISFDSALQQGTKFTIRFPVLLSEQRERDIAPIQQLLTGKEEPWKDIELKS